MAPNSESALIAIIIPVCNEAASIGAVVRGLREALPHGRFVISIGLNGTTDASATVALEHGADFVGEADQLGYGHGCLAAIDALPDDVAQKTRSYVFFAGDGANDPADVIRLVTKREECAVGFVIGLRRFDLGTWREEFGRALPNLILGIGVFALTSRFFNDLGPLRLIDVTLFDRMKMRETTWGWTIESQVMAARLGESIKTISVVERPRYAGEQKVSGVSLWRSIKIGLAIFAAGLRTRFRRI